METKRRYKLKRNLVLIVLLFGIVFFLFYISTSFIFFFFLAALFYYLFNPNQCSDVFFFTIAIFWIRCLGGSGREFLATFYGRIFWLVSLQRISKREKCIVDEKLFARMLWNRRLRSYFFFQLFLFISRVYYFLYHSIWWCFFTSFKLGFFLAAATNFRET